LPFSLERRDIDDDDDKKDFPTEVMTAFILCINSDNITNYYYYRLQ
jgi:hypothetical protein